MSKSHLYSFFSFEKETIQNIINDSLEQVKQPKKQQEIQKEQQNISVPEIVFAFFVGLAFVFPAFYFVFLFHIVFLLFPFFELVPRTKAVLYRETKAVSI